jgi:hypothetical protein
LTTFAPLNTVISFSDVHFDQGGMTIGQMHRRARGALAEFVQTVDGNDACIVVVDQMDQASETAHLTTNTA